jgi:hypothetical protein
VHTNIYLSLDFSQKGFYKESWRHKYAESVSPKIFPMGYKCFSQHNGMTSFIFLTGSSTMQGEC